MKHVVFFISLLLLLGYIGCNSPSADYDIHENIVENNLSGNWQVTLEIGSISEKKAYSTIDLDDAYDWNGLCSSWKINPDYQVIEEMIEFMNQLPGEQVGLTMELQLVNNEHYYEADLGISDFESDILVHLEEGSRIEVFEIYSSIETEFKQLSMSGVFQDNKLTLSLEEDVFQFTSTGELMIEDNNVYILNGDFSWTTEYFFIQGSWLATQTE